MKTAKEWDLQVKTALPDYPVFRELVEAIQRDAVEAVGTPLTNQQEIELAQSIAANERIRADQLHEQLLKMREKWLDARKHLRAANKGAERNAVALGLKFAWYAEDDPGHRDHLHAETIRSAKGIKKR